MADSLFFGFDVDRTAALGAELRSAAAECDRRAADIHALLDEGNSLAGGSGYTLQTRLQRVGGWLHLTATETSALKTVSADAPDMALEIDRRLVQLVSCQAAVNLGLHIDPGDVFLNEDPVDPARIADVLATFREAMNRDHGANGNHDDLVDMSKALYKLTDAELDAALAALTDAELATWNSQLAEADEEWSATIVSGVAALAEGRLSMPGWRPSKDDLFHAVNGLDTPERVELVNMLLLKSSSSTIRRLAEHVPAIQPRLAGDHHDYGYRLADGPLFVDDIDLITDMDQGRLGDCWFLASLGAVANADPAFIRRHVTQNANGTYTVTLYRDGKPIPVTVTADLPWDAERSELIYAGAPSKNPSDELWVAVYEKAFAQYRGGYGNTEGGFGVQAMPIITGQDAQLHVAAFASLGKMDEWLHDGHAITLGSKIDREFWKHNDYIGDEKKVLSQHEYVVKSIDMSADPPTITVVNPWGSPSSPSDPIKQVLTLTEGQMKDVFAGVSVGKIP